MTETPASPPTKSVRSGTNQLLVDLGPIAVFVIAYNVLNRIPSLAEEAVYISTGIFIVATIATIIYCRLTRGSVPPVLIVTGVLVTAFGGLTLALHDQRFIQMKPTFVYGFYAAAIFGSMLFKLNIWKLLFGHAFTLPDRIWNVLALRWGAFFVFMAILNEIIRRTQDFDFWLSSRLWLVFPLVIVFALANTPLVLKHQPPETNDTVT